MKHVRVELSCGFLVWLAWLNFLDRRNIVPMALLACFLHEMGHLFAVVQLNGMIHSIKVTAAGAQMELSHPLGYKQELLAALAGPGVNIILSVMFAQWQWGYLFSGLNLALACLNLIPIGNLDGGRILHCFLCIICSPDLANQICDVFSFLFLLFLFFISLLLIFCARNFTLAMVTLWLLIIFFTGKN